MAASVREIYVREIMTSSPVTCSPGITARQAALIMKKKGVGSLVVIEEEEPVGILTEKDLVGKVIAEDRKPSKVKVETIMTAPLIVTSPDVSLAEAADRMAELGLRRLPVVEGNSLVGILTENDILRISPSLIELTREWARINSPGPDDTPSHTYSGYCESCGAYSDLLREEGGRLLCASCLESLK